jgi:large subunit ribosomal protein L4
MALTGKVFTEEMNEAVVHETLRWLLASRRRGTHSAKTRAEVSGGGIKPWKQKGTGRARAGSIRSPLWRKGGVIFPPKPRDYSYALPKKVRKLALRVVLSEFNRGERVKLVESLSLPEPKTKAGAKFLQDLGVTGGVLILMAEEKSDFVRGTRNLAGVKILLAKDLNIYDLLKAEWVVIEKKAVPQLEERLV